MDDRPVRLARGMLAGGVEWQGDGQDNNRQCSFQSSRPHGQVSKHDTATHLQLLGCNEDASNCNELQHATRHTLRVVQGSRGGARRVCFFCGQHARCHKADKQPTKRLTLEAARKRSSNDTEACSVSCCRPNSSATSTIQETTTRREPASRSGLVARRDSAATTGTSTAL